MPIDDLWVSRKTGEHLAKYGTGLRWRVRVKGHRVRLARTRPEAERIERELIRTDPDAQPSTVTVGELLTRWLAGKAGLSKSGRSSASAAACHVREEFGWMRAADVQPWQVQKWIAGLKARHGTRDEPVWTPASRDTRSKALQALRGALKIASQDGVEVADLSDVRVPRGAGSRPARFVTAGELAAIAQASREPTMIWLLGTTGVRIGECCRLVVGDVDAQRLRLVVRQSKSGRAREVPIPSKVLAMLDLQREPGAPLFPAPRGGCWSPDNFRKRVWEPVAPSGMVVHDLRHTAASLMIRSGATVKDVQQALGHASAKVTLDIYAGWWDDGLDDVGRRMDGLI